MPFRISELNTPLAASKIGLPQDASLVEILTEAVENFWNLPEGFLESLGLKHRDEIPGALVWAKSKAYRLKQQVQKDFERQQEQAAPRHGAAPNTQVIKAKPQVKQIEIDVELATCISRIYEFKLKETKLRPLNKNVSLVKEAGNFYLFAKTRQAADSVAIEASAVLWRERRLALRDLIRNSKDSSVSYRLIDSAWKIQLITDLERRRLYRWIAMPQWPLAFYPERREGKRGHPREIGEPTELTLRSDVMPSRSETVVNNDWPLHQ